MATPMLAIDQARDHLQRLVPRRDGGDGDAEVTEGPAERLTPMRLAATNGLGGWDLSRRKRHAREGVRGHARPRVVRTWSGVV